jgi:magnesium-transporting ATPase (P-type)
MIKNKDPKAVTLAIGDGANDVNMIQKANIGVGIFGNEGYQAASASDYAIGRFKHLERLLFVHGRYTGIRISTYIFMFFYKNLIFALPQFWFGLFAAYSANSYWDELYITGYNTWITALGIGIYAISDCDIQIENCPNEDVIKHMLPFLYREADDEEGFTIKKFFFLLFMGIFHSILIFIVPMFAVQNRIDS